MARPKQYGIDYFSFDVDFFDDPKILFVSSRFDEKGEIVVVKLLCWIYRTNGYYMDWNEEVSMLFAKRAFTNIKYSLVNDIVMELIKRDFFTEDLFNRFGILTSIGIQKRWVNSVKKRNVEIRREYCLLPEELFPESTQNTPESTENTPETQEKPPVIPQSKVNNIIINKEVENRINKNSEKPIKETFAELAKDEAWLEVLAMNNQMKSTLAVKNKLQTFYKHLQNIGEETKSITDAKRHFANWLKTNK